MAIITVLSLAALTLAGCSMGSSTSDPRPTDVPTATATPTVIVSYGVVVTPFPTATPRRLVLRHRQRPFTPPSGPYLRLFPATGPPVSSTILVIGGHLPALTEVDLAWLPGGHLSPLTDVAYSDKKGFLRSHFSVPGSPPGTYFVAAEVNGVRFAVARYSVTSAAVLAANATPARVGESVQISGRKFLPNLRFLLVAYPVFRGSKAVSLGTVVTDGHGRFLDTRQVRGLSPGEYVLRAWSANSVAAQTAESFFAVSF